jgi:hypothetical protein
MDVESNGIQGACRFIQIHASVRIKTLHHVCVSFIMIAWVKISSTHPFIG